MGKVSELTESEAIIVMNGDLTLHVSIPSHFSKDFTKGAEVSVSIRPEKITILEDKPDSSKNVFTGIIEDQAYLGSMTKNYILLDSGHKLTNVSESRYKIGKKIYVKIEPDDCLALPENGEICY
jgi:ABC-type Fe3+/spermidine/putrescine transport system ATPase subunit